MGTREEKGYVSRPLISRFIPSEPLTYLILSGNASNVCVLLPQVSLSAAKETNRVNHLLLEGSGRVDWFRISLVPSKIQEMGSQQP